MACMKNWQQPQFKTSNSVLKSKIHFFDYTFGENAPLTTLIAYIFMFFVPNTLVPYID